MPETTTTRVVIIGAGAGGIGLAIMLERAGIDDYVIFDKADGLGGTWRVNTYPGAECDVPSHLYSYSFALNPEWSKTFAGQAEILRYLEECAESAGVTTHLRLGTAVESVSWSEDCARWFVSTTDGQQVWAQVVVSAVGMFNAPAYPDLPGLDRFGGSVMHSARWHHDVAIDGQRVAVIGTGASAIQIVPAIAPTVGHLDVFQRSPAWIMPRDDEPFTADQRRRFAESPLDARRHRHGIYRFYEGNTVIKVDDRRVAVFEKFARAHLENSVADPELRAKLLPDYPIGCKRILLSSEFYPAIQRANVELVTDAIDHVTASGIVTADGVEHPLDVIVLATGYRATDYLHGLDVVGRDARRLHDDWTEPRAYLGMVVAGYPNFFVFYGPNTNQGGNSILLILEAESRYVVDALQTMDREGIEVIEVKDAVVDAYNEALDAELEGTVWGAGCGNYFRSASGRVATQLPHPSRWYRQRTRRIDLDDYKVTASRPGPQAR
jgi:cation diffusion facilitator CzcD-associated flavoprotein CzcO